MGRLSQHVIMAAVGFFFVFSVIVGVSHLIYPADRTSRLDTGNGSRFYAPNPREIVFQRDLLISPAPKVIIVGASNAREGLRPERLEKFFPKDTEIHNMSLGGSNITEMVRVLELAFEMIPDNPAPDLTVMIGAWHGNFVTAARRFDFAPTTVDVELERNHVPKFGPSGGNGTWPAEIFPLWKRVMHPFLALRPIRQQIVDMLKAAPRPDVIDAVFRDEAIAKWRSLMGEDSEMAQEQYDLFFDIASKLTDKGVKLIVVDLPIASWHADRVGYDESHMAKLNAVFQRLSHLTNAGKLQRISLSGANTPDTLFRDSSHPTGEGARLWSDYVGRALSH